MKIKYNGNLIDVKENTTIQELLKEQGVKNSVFVVEKNLEIVQKEKYNSEIIKENDSIEVISFVGGG